jgi:deoxyadenosine/deoxycytidine kinase
MSGKAVFTLSGMEAVGHYITIQGSIGAGKSTLLASIRRYLERNHLSAIDPDCESGDSFLVVDEPLGEWLVPKYGPDKSLSILEAFYRQPKELGFAFQVNAFTSRLRHLRDSLNKLPPTQRGRVHIIAERSMSTDRVFFETVCEHNHALEIEWDVYSQFFALICDDLNQREDMMVYLPVSPTVCQERIAGRCRLEETENKIDPGYLALLDEKHRKMASEFGASPGRTLIRLDSFEANLCEEEIDSITEKFMEDLLTRIR